MPNTNAKIETHSKETAMPINAHCFWIDNDGAMDIDELSVLRESFKANLGLTLHCTGNNPEYLVYVGY